VTLRAEYDVDGVPLAVDVAERLGSDALDAIDRRLRSFRATAPATFDPSAVVRIHLGAEPLTPPAGASRAVYDSAAGTVQYCDDEATLFAEIDGGAQVRCRPRDRLALLACRPSSVESLWRATHPLLTLALIELLKHQGRFSLHAAGVVSDGRAILIAGPSGAGKSTLAVGLARSGLAFMADDTVFLHARPDRLDVVGFADEVDVTGQTLSMFEELAPAARRQPVGGGKWSLRLEEALATTQVRCCPPGLVVLARVSDRETSRISPVAASEALVELAPNVLLTDAPTAQAHLAALAQLVATTPCVRLDTGRDFDRLPARLAGARAARVS
jgi:hypothetical protein